MFSAETHNVKQKNHLRPGAAIWFSDRVQLGLCEKNQGIAKAE
jgi:hypothetical protein